jgi:hypothetical protein
MPHVQKAQENPWNEIKKHLIRQDPTTMEVFWNPNPQHRQMILHKDFLLHMDGILATHVFEERILLSKFGGCNKKRIKSFSGIQSLHSLYELTY